MIRVDGSEKSGSGTILRYALALGALLEEEVQIDHIRARRKKPGLRPQHLKGVLALREMTGGTVEGAKVNSSRVRYVPGGKTSKTAFDWDIGTAGSTTMLALSVLPVAAFSASPLRMKVSGGLFQDFAPSAYHMQYVLLPLLERMGLRAALEPVRPGYVPRGGGQIVLEVHPVQGSLAPISMTEQGQIRQVRGISLASHLRRQKVTHRMASRCSDILRSAGLEVHFDVIEDDRAYQKGAALFVAASSDRGCLIGSDRAGAIGRQSEQIGQWVADQLLRDLHTGATVDRYLADQIILFAGLAAGKTEYLLPRMTEHVRTNIWLIETILGATVHLTGNRVTINGIGYTA
jgi:RNA 3'-terminal phosphate cyclase (ATP)